MYLDIHIVPKQKFLLFSRFKLKTWENISRNFLVCFVPTILSKLERVLETDFILQNWLRSLVVMSKLSNAFNYFSASLKLVYFSVIQISSPLSSSLQMRFFGSLTLKVMPLIPNMTLDSFLQLHLITCVNCRRCVFVQKRWMWWKS